MQFSTGAFDMLQSWTETQQKIWTGWIETVQGIGRSPTPDLRGKIIDIWQESVTHMLEAQATWMQSWSDILASESTPQGTQELLKQVQEGMQQWNEAQRQLWDELFSVMRKASPDIGGLSLQKEATNIFGKWQETVRTLMPVTKE